jgi:DNA-binding response OmpR family regulator
MTGHTGDAPLESSPFKPSITRGISPMILLAESDAMVGEFGRLILEKQGYRVLVAEGGVQTVEIFRQAAERIDLVVVDLNIPGLAVDAVLTRLLALEPKVGVLFSSSYFPEDRPDGGSRLWGVISKPYLRQELVTMVQRALAQRRDFPDNRRERPAEECWRQTGHRERV